MNPKVYIAGERGMVGGAIARLLDGIGVKPSDAWIDGGDYYHPEEGEYLSADHVFLACGKVGGIQANLAKPVDFLWDNIAMTQRHLEGARLGKVKKLLYLGSSCMYPRDCPQPMKESDLWTGPLEPTNEAYAVAKLAGEALCRAYRKQYGCNFITAIPCNLYGTGDHYEPERAHVIPALIRRFTEARDQGVKEVRLMGTGKARREFLHVDDMAQAALFLMDTYNEAEPINVGWGKDSSIWFIAETIARIIGYRGTVVFTGEGPDGMPRKCLDVSRMKALGWEPKIGLVEGLERTIKEAKW